MLSTEVINLCYCKW